MDELRQWVDSDPEFFNYVRMHPYYIRRIYRDESVFSELLEHFRVDTHKTFGDRVERIGQLATLAQMFF